MRWNKAGSQKRLSSEGYGLGINDAGDVAGILENSDGIVRAFVWRNDAMTILPALWEYGLAAGHSINNRGQVVGSSMVQGGRYAEWHAVRWDEGVPIDLGALPGGNPARAVDLNDDGLAVGWAADSEGRSHAMRWDAGTMTDLGTLPGGRYAEASAVNRHGQIVGKSTFASSRGYQYHAVAWVDGVATDLQSLPGHFQSEALGINSTATIVGRSQFGEFGPWVATVWLGVGQAPIDLNSLVEGGACVDDAGAAWVLSSATDVNDKGQISATSERPAQDGTTRSAAFRLTPQ